MVNSVVSRVVKFGGFGQVEKGLEGLIHLLELNPNIVLEKGNRVPSKVLVERRPAGDRAIVA